MQKGISIILPTLNRADYLASTVDCLIEQDFGEPYEIIIVDQSAAIDSTMYSRAKDSDTLIKYYHVTEFRGLPEARNFGVQHTQYAYILFLDDDIECDCNLLKEHYKFLSQPDIAVVAGGITEKYKNNPKSKNVGKFHFYTATPERGFHINHKEYVDHGGGGNYSIKKDLFSSHSKTFQLLEKYFNFLFLLQLFEKCFNSKPTTGQLLNYRFIVIQSLLVYFIYCSTS